MFPRQNQNQFRNSNADVQIFYQDATWNKPVGVSHVYMMLIGGGGDGDSSKGGGSGAVTVWYGSAKNVPDNLRLIVSTGNQVGSVIYYKNSTSNYVLLQANAGNSTVSGTAGTSTTANQFAASGFYQSVAGQAGAPSNQNPSATTFLTGGAYENIQANYGYSIPNGNQNGFFMLQPIIIGCGAAGHLTGANALKAGIGCGGSYGVNVSAFGLGGPGMVLIASW